MSVMLRMILLLFDRWEILIRERSAFAPLINFFTYFSFCFPLQFFRSWPFAFVDCRNPHLSFLK